VGEQPKIVNARNAQHRDYRRLPKIAPEFTARHAADFAAT
jgi:hypothetical protein